MMLKKSFNCLKGVQAYGLAALVAFAFYAVPALAQVPCVKHDPYHAVTYLLVDRSDPAGNLSALEQTLHSVEEAIAPGERLIVGVSVGSAADTRVVMDVVKPEPSVWESALKVRAKEKAFKDCLSATKSGITGSSETAKHSALLETLSFVSSVLMAGPEIPSRRLVMFSDMIQNTPELSFWGSSQVVPKQALQKVEKDNLLPNLKGVAVYVAGAGGGLPAAKAQQLQEFWKAYFEKSGARLKFYGPLLLGIS
jgi:hypothetical protein